jgi:TRAP-type C4-dicarboxylate transport system substrate-binding protein
MVGNTNTFYVVMNADKWNKLPADLKKIFEEVGMEFKEKHALAWNESDIEAIQAFKQQGGQVTYLDDAEAARWKKAVEPLVEEYKQKSVSAGFKAAEVDSWISFIRERVAYWTKAANDKGLKSWWQY